MTPTRAGRLVLVVIALPLRAVGAEEVRGLRLAQMPGVLQDRWDFGVRHEIRPSLLIPVENGPDPALLTGIAEHRGTLRTVQGALVSALVAEHLQELVHILDCRRRQDHFGSPSSCRRPGGRLENDSPDPRWARHR